MDLIDGLDNTNKHVLETFNNTSETLDTSQMVSLVQRAMTRWSRYLQSSTGFYREEPGSGGAHAEMARQLKNARVKGFSTQKAKDYIFKLGEMLELDESQTEILLWYFLKQHYLKIMATRTDKEAFRFREEDTNEIFSFYNVERVSALKSMASLFRIAMDSAHKHKRVAEAAVKKLKEVDVFHTALSLYSELSNTAIPTRLNEVQKAMWVTRNLEEQVACLELLFLVLYGYDKFNTTYFMELVTVFEQQAFGVHQLNRTFLNEDCQSLVTRIGHLSVLVLLACMNMESVLHDERARKYIEADIFPTDVKSLQLCLDRLRSINERLLKWGTIRHQGPILLAWAAFHCRIEQITNKFPELKERCSKSKIIEQYVGEVPFQSFAASAFETSVMEFLTNCSSCLSKGERGGDEPNLVGYKSCLKHLLSAVLTAFDIQVMPHFQHFVSFAIRLFTGQPSLCTQFWELDYKHPGRGSILHEAKSRYPFELIPWLRLLRALAGEKDAAIFALNEVQNMNWYTQMLPLPPQCQNRGCMSLASVKITVPAFSSSPPQVWFSCNEHAAVTMDHAKDASHVADASSIISTPIVQASAAISQPLADNPALLADHAIFFPDDGVHVPAGSKGVLLWSAPTQSQKDIMHVVHWRGVPTGWTFLIRKVSMFLSPSRKGGIAATQEGVDSVATILGLLSRLLETNPKVAYALPKYMEAQQEMDRRNGSNQLPVPDLLSILFGVVEAVPILPRNLKRRKLATRALRCITGFAHAFPAQVWDLFVRSSFLKSSYSSVSGMMASASGGAIHHILQTQELPSGRYTATLAFLELLQTLLTHVLQWPFPNPSTAPSRSHQDFLPCLRYIRSEVLASYYSWKYVRVHERWEMGIRILSVIECVLTDVRPIVYDSLKRSARGSGGTLRESLLLVLKEDSSFHHVLLSVVGIGHNILQRKADASQHEDRRTLELLITRGLSVLELLLATHINDHSDSSLGHALLTRTVGRDRADYLVLVIAQYVHYPHNWKLPYLATRVLTRVCSITTSSHARPPSILGYLGDAAPDIRQTWLQLLESGKESEMRISILRLIGAAVEHQPGLAETLLTAPEEGGVVGRRSAVEIILDMLSRRKLYNYNPRLLSEALSLLHSLWNRAPNHTSILKSIRMEGKSDAKKNFWKTLTQCLDLERTETKDRWADIFHVNLAHYLQQQNDITGPLKATTPGQQNDIVKYCYNIMLHSMVLRIIALEVYYASSSALDEDLLELITVMRDRMQVRWFNEYTRFFFPSMKRRLEAKCRIVGLNPVVLAQRGSSSIGRGYGDSYVYDYGLLKEKLREHIDNPDVQELSLLLSETNNQLSIADAQIVLLESWKTLLQVGVAKIPGKLIDASRGPDMGIKLIHGFGNKIESRFRVLSALGPHENPYMVEVVIGDLLDIGQHFTRVYLQTFLLGDQSVTRYLVNVYCKLFKCVVDSLAQLEASAASNGTKREDGTDKSKKNQQQHGTAENFAQSVQVSDSTVEATLEEMLRVKRHILTTTLSVLLLFVQHQPEVFKIKDNKKESANSENNVELYAIWEVIFSDVVSLVPFISKHCIKLQSDVVIDSTNAGGDSSRMLTSTSLALVSALLRTISDAGPLHLLHNNLASCGFVAKIVSSLQWLLNRPQLCPSSRDETDEEEGRRNRVLAFVELLLNVIVGLAGNPDTVSLLVCSDLMRVLCDNSLHFFLTLSTSVESSVGVAGSGAGVGANAAAGVGVASLMNKPKQDPGLAYFRVWCLMMGVVARALHFVDSSSHVEVASQSLDLVRDGMTFVSVHKKRIFYVFQSIFVPPFVMTLAIVQETRRACELLYALASKHLPAWKLKDHGVVTAAEKSVLSFLSQGAFLLGRPEVLIQYCRPGRGLDAQLVLDDAFGRGSKGSTKRGPSLSRRASLRRVSLTATMTGSSIGASMIDDGGDHALGLSFSERLQVELFDAVRVCLAFTRHASPSLWRVSSTSSLRAKNSALQLVPLVSSSVDRPVSMSDSPSLGTLELLVASLIQQLSDFWSKSSERLNLRVVDIMSISRIGSTLVLPAMEDVEGSRSRADNHSSKESSSEEKRTHVVTRAAHVLLKDIEETLFLLISHAHYFLSWEAAHGNPKGVNDTNRRFSSQNTNHSNITDRGGITLTLAQNSQIKQQNQQLQFQNQVSVSSKITDELSASVLRQLLRLTKMIEARLHSAPPMEEALLNEKQSFFNFARDFFGSLGTASEMVQ